jgi:23S rRNA pseudouridine2605 synthase
MRKDKTPSSGKTEKKTAGSNVWEIKNNPEKNEGSKREPKTHKSYSDRPRKQSSDRKPRRESFDKPRKFSQDREPRRESFDKPRKYSQDREPRRESFDKPRRYSQDREPRRESFHKPERQDKIFRPRKSFDTNKPHQHTKNNDGLVRLNKFIANSGICSRREADEYIVAGVVSVNGEIVTELGTKVRTTDEIRFNNERIRGERKVYILLNKPKNYITTTEDPHAQKTVMELIDGICTQRVYPVGRLDRNSTGVLLFTNDGDLAKQLTHPSFNKLKVYQVKLDRNLTKADQITMVEGIELEDGVSHVDSIFQIGDSKDEVGIEIHSGKNRVIRRMFEKLGYNVLKLDRVYFAGLTKKGLKRGQCRLLTPKEIEMLKMGAYE